MRKRFTLEKIDGSNCTIFMNRKEFLYTSSMAISGLVLRPISMPVPRQKIRIGMITDLHYADRSTPQNSSRYYRESLEKLRDCVDEMNREKVDFLIQVGDFKDQDEPPVEARTLEYLETMVQEFNRFDGPTYHVLGNHDHDSISKDQFLGRVKNTGFRKAKNYYSFDRNGFHFIILDANYTSAGIPYDHGNFDWKDCYIPEDQLTWLKRDLKSTKKPAVVFVHQRLDEKEDNKNYCVGNAGAVRSVLEDTGKVALVVQGHDHRGDLNSINGIVYYTLPGAIEGSGLENNSFAILEIDPSMKMNLIGFRKTISKVFTE